MMETDGLQKQLLICYLLEVKTVRKGILQQEEGGGRNANYTLARSKVIQCHLL
jgi:hypothetical protein